MAVKLGDAVLYFAGDDSKLRATMNRTGGQVRSWGSQVAGFFSNAFSFVVGNLITNGIQRVTQAIAGLKEGMIGGNAEFEVYNARFEQLLGNARLAEERLKDLAHFGATTPFDLPGVVKADVILQAFGFHAANAADRFGKTGEEVRRIAGDVAAGTSAQFEEISTYLGKFAAGSTAQPLMRLAQLGAITREELEALGIEFNSAGSVISDVDQAMGILLQALEDKFGGLMDIQSATFEGMMSNLRDWIENALRMVGKPVFDRAKAALKTLVDFLSSPEATGALESFSAMLGATIEVLETLVKMLIGDNLFSGMEQWADQLADRFETVRQFMVQLKDELQGLSGEDILAELGPGLQALNDEMAESLSDLDERYNETVTKLTARLELAQKRASDAMAEIAAEFGPQLDEINARYEKQVGRSQRRLNELISDFREARAEKAAEAAAKLEEMEEEHRKKRTKIQEQIADETANLEEKLTELKAEHQKRRRELSQSLLLAESEEEWLRIKQQLDAEDKQYKESQSKAKSDSEEKKKELEARLAEEDAQYEKAVEKYEATLEKQEKAAEKSFKRQKRSAEESLADQQEAWDKAVDEINDKRAEQEKAIQDALDEETNYVKTALEEERMMYEENQSRISESFKQQMAEMEEEIRRRAAAIGSGPAAEAAAYLIKLVDGIKSVSSAVSEFVNQHGPLLLAILGSIAAVLVGQAVIAAVAALGAAIAGISLPIVALVGAVALLYTAWTQNWGGIQQKTQAVIDWMTPYIDTAINWINTSIQNAMAMWRSWWEEHGAAVMVIVEWLWSRVKLNFENAYTFITTILTGLQMFWQQHGDWLTTMFTLMWDNLKIILSTALIVMTQLIEAFAALIQGDFSGFRDAIVAIWQAIWDGLKNIASNNIQMLIATLGEFIETIVALFTEYDWSKIGTAMWEGIKQGMKDAKDSLVDTATDAANSMVDSMKDNLQMDSPSKLTKEIGGEGVAGGVEAGFMERWSKVLKTMKDATSQIPGALDPAMAKAKAAPQVTYYQQNHFPPAPDGQINEAELLKKQQQQTMELLFEHYIED